MVLCIWQNSNGNWNVAYLDNWNGKRKLNLNWFNNRWNRNYRVLAFRKSLYSPVFYGSFFFNSFFQPPSIFPTSSSSVDNEIYFLLSIIFNCQAICKKNFVKSSFKFALMRIGNFSSLVEFAERNKSLIRLITKYCTKFL